ncbi:alpha/beta fold hydrolase [Paenibacillus montanisoli]|uniref:Alpha/beta hydrolase n=1 Tax=Paenibacillus montanisoli TaxID=2081970 RepID=A0A328U3R5_9BACL|nr:alpha/beta hydrolase [Paenibacillus montanisoli]RAP77279.1 alpha/beta hydrolase [Paenibacillus montanisoli]
MIRSTTEHATCGTILWLTGWSMPAAIFSGLQARLPGFQHVKADYTAVHTAEEMLALTENAARNNKGALIAGWSLGALLALRLAANGLAGGLLLISGTAGFIRPHGVWPDLHVRQMMTSIMQNRHAVETKFRKLLFTDSERKAGMEELLPQTGSWTTSALIAGLNVLRSEEYLSRLNQIKCPVLLIHGVEDTVCPYGAVKELSVKLSQAALVTLEESGHVPFLGKEEAVATAVRRWWNA